MKKKTVKSRPAEKIMAGLHQALGHAKGSNEGYEEGFAAGRLAMQAEIDASLIAGLVAVNANSASKLPVLVSHATVEAITRFWNKHNAPSVTMESAWRVVSNATLRRSDAEPAT